MVLFLLCNALQCKARSCNRMSTVCPSVCDIGGSWPNRLKILETVQTISPTSSQRSSTYSERSSTYSQGTWEKFWGENVRSSPTSITSGWTESTKSHVILGGGVAVCLLLSAHRVVIFAIAQLSPCYCMRVKNAYGNVIVMCEQYDDKDFDICTNPQYAHNTTLCMLTALYKLDTTELCRNHIPPHDARGTLYRQSTAAKLQRKYQIILWRLIADMTVIIRHVTGDGQSNQQTEMFT